METPDLEDVTPEELLRYIGRADAEHVTKEQVAAFLRAGHGPGVERRVLHHLSAVSARAREMIAAGETDPQVVIRAIHVRRVTGWLVRCSCGVRGRKAAASRRNAQLAAGEHLNMNHDGIGSVVVRDVNAGLLG